MSESCCHQGRSNILKRILKDSRCGRWTKEKCKKIHEKVQCCSEKTKLEEELNKAIEEIVQRPITVTMACDNFTPHFCNILSFLQLDNETCCESEQLDDVPIEEESL